MLLTDAAGTKLFDMPPEAIATAPVGTKESPSPKGFPFRLALPLGQLVICALLLLPIRGYIFYALGLTRLAEPSLPFQLGGPVLRPFVQWSREHSVQTVIALNLPGAVFQLPFELKKNWNPPVADRRIWSAISFPIFGMVFWWIAGRSVDALVAARKKRLAPRIGGLETGVGFLIMVSGVIAAVWVVRFSGPDRSGLYELAGAEGMWTILGGLTVAARVAQRRIVKKLRADTPNPQI